MKMFRVSLAAILGAVALATTVEQPSGDTAGPEPAAAATAAVPTETPLVAAEHARDSALERANQTLHSVMHKEQENRHLAENEDLVDQEVATIETAVPNTTQHYSRQRKRLMHERQHERKHAVHEVVDAAKAAANAYKQAARVLEAQRRHAGLPESVYEAGYNHDEGLSEGWHDEAENYGDAAENHIEAFFDAVEDKIEVHVDQQRRSQREHSEEGDFGEQEEQPQQDHRDDHQDDHQDNHRDDQHDDQHDNRQDDQAPASIPATAAPAHVSDDTDVVRHNMDQQSTVVASTELNLRAVAQSPRNDGQGFLLTFACIGFLASMAFAVQMQSRPTLSQAREPLLIVA